jgi:hypothetical protein
MKAWDSVGFSMDGVHVTELLRNKLISQELAPDMRFKGPSLPTPLGVHSPQRPKRPAGLRQSNNTKYLKWKVSDLEWEAKRALEFPQNYCTVVLNEMGVRELVDSNEAWEAVQAGRRTKDKRVSINSEVGDILKPGRGYLEKKLAILEADEAKAADKKEKAGDALASKTAYVTPSCCVNLVFCCAHSLARFL